MKIASLREFVRLLKYLRHDTTATQLLLDAVIVGPNGIYVKPLDF